MVSLLKSTVVSVGLLAGLAASAQAQSVSALPPDAGMSEPTQPPQTARSPVFGSTQSFYPKPGGGVVITKERRQPPVASGNGTRWTGPKPT